MNNKTLVLKIGKNNFEDTISRAAHILKQGGTACTV
jgi:tRNA1(Val) A37 N6-methylase TrmN6